MVTLSLVLFIGGACAFLFAGVANHLWNHMVGAAQLALLIGYLLGLYVALFWQKYWPLVSTSDLFNIHRTRKV
jgi:hypothetical protein